MTISSTLRRVLDRLLRRRPSGRDALLEHLVRCAKADATLVVNGNADFAVQRMLAAGWTLHEDEEVVAAQIHRAQTDLDRDFRIAVKRYLEENGIDRAELGGKLGLTPLALMTRLDYNGSLMDLVAIAAAAGARVKVSVEVAGKRIRYMSPPGS